MDKQKVENETTFQKMVAGLSKAASLIADRQIKRRIEPDAGVKFVLKNPDEDSKILAPVWVMVRPIFNSFLGLIEGLDRDRKAAQAERDALAAERERIKLVNAAMATEFAALMAETSIQLNAFKDAVFDLTALRHEMTRDQLQRLNAVVGDDELTPF